jgi:hypothetical protein
MWKAAHEFRAQTAYVSKRVKDFRTALRDRAFNPSFVVRLSLVLPLISIAAAEGFCYTASTL